MSLFLSYILPGIFQPEYTHTFLVSCSIPSVLLLIMIYDVMSAPVLMISFFFYSCLGKLPSESQRVQVLIAPVFQAMINSQLLRKWWIEGPWLRPTELWSSFIIDFNPQNSQNIWTDGCKLEGNSLVYIIYNIFELQNKTSKPRLCPPIIWW